MELAPKRAMLFYCLRIVLNDANKFIVCVRERETERQRHREKERERERDRQTDRDLSFCHDVGVCFYYNEMNCSVRNRTFYHLCSANLDLPEHLHSLISLNFRHEEIFHP